MELTHAVWIRGCLACVVSAVGMYSGLSGTPVGDPKSSESTVDPPVTPVPAGSSGVPMRPLRWEAKRRILTATTTTDGVRDN
jgi:hypothetical protein